MDSNVADLDGSITCGDCSTCFCLEICFSGSIRRITITNVVTIKKTKIPIFEMVFCIHFYFNTNGTLDTFKGFGYTPHIIKPYCLCPIPALLPVKKRRRGTMFLTLTSKQNVNSILICRKNDLWTHLLVAPS